jgi:hypothetical protein
MAVKPLSLKRDREHIFHRTQLAESILDQLADPGYKSGLFLSAPRRTGKTTFIKADLLPMLREAGAIVIYADLWEQKHIDPARVIVAAIGEAILHESGAVTKAAKLLGLKKVRLGGLEMDLDAIGTQDGDSIARTLEKLSAATDKPIVMVIDEAQHAQTTEEGRHTMFALKAARDAMILGDGAGFRLIATGSNSDRLMTLVASKDQAFFHARQEHLPELDDTYLAWVLDHSPFKAHLSLGVLHQAFEIFSRRPEPLQALLAAFERDRALDPATLDRVFVEGAHRAMETARQAFMVSLRSMDALDAAVFRRMARLGRDFTPFDGEALRDYERLMREAVPDADVAMPGPSAVQVALERLRKESLIWNAGRGLWFVEDSQHGAWALADTQPPATPAPSVA